MKLGFYSQNTQKFQKIAFSLLEFFESEPRILASTWAAIVIDIFA